MNSPFSGTIDPIKVTQESQLFRMEIAPERVGTRALRCWRSWPWRRCH
jgi:hypothetical protein